MRQVHDAEFEQALHERLVLAAQRKRPRWNWLEAKSSEGGAAFGGSKDAEISAKGEIDAVGVEKQVAVSEALSECNRERT